VSAKAAEPAELAARIDAFAALASLDADRAAVRAAVEALLDALETGSIRSAARDASGRWIAVPWVKRGILLGFRVGVMVSERVGPFAFIDKDTFPARALTVADGVRMVAGGSAVRRGSHLAPGVICVPPMYVNVGAWVGRDSLVDSHALVGSCAQVGERVHLSAAAQLGGVLEPVNAAPVVVEDDVIIGGNCGVYEGTVIRAGAVLGAGVILTRSTPVYDLVHERVYRGTAAEPLEIPAGAVVVPGARTIARGWGQEQGLALQTPVIVKYRDDKTEASVALEEWLR
jgi:2,3,4,5-tetrahydropyridine-2-carboxylate N-succinyltransferase